MATVLTKSGVETLAVNRHQDSRGVLVAFDLAQGLPFPLARTYAISLVPAGVERGHHAHRRLKQVFYAIGGTFRLSLDSGTEKLDIIVGSDSGAIYVPPLHWLRISEFSLHVSCLVLASESYSKADYINDYQEFLALSARAREVA